jgi:hypothetical protein
MDDKNMGKERGRKIDGKKMKPNHVPYFPALNFPA